VHLLLLLPALALIGFPPSQLFYQVPRLLLTPRSHIRREFGVLRTILDGPTAQADVPAIARMANAIPTDSPGRNVQDNPSAFVPEFDEELDRIPA
jgi:hypothetical protein